MPFYEYGCTNCGHATTILQKLSDPPAVECPACHTPGLTKQISAAGFRLKGAGWYETDFKSDNKRNLAGDTAEVAKTDKAGEKNPDKSAAQPAEKASDKTADKAADKPAEKAVAKPAGSTAAPASTPAPTSTP